MSSDISPGLVMGTFAMAIGVYAAIATLYLWALNRAKQILDPAV